MRRSQTVSVTVRLPVGIAAIMNDMVERGLFASSSDFIRAMIIKAMPMIATGTTGGPVNGIEIPQMTEGAEEMQAQEDIATGSNDQEPTEVAETAQGA